MKKKLSFISIFFGSDNYEKMKIFASRIFLLGTPILVLLYVLSYLFHNDVICFFIGLLTGFSLLFIAYVLGVIVFLDIKVEVDDYPENDWDMRNYEPKSFKYKLTKVWTIILIITGITLIYVSNRYRKYYVFECETYLVDKKAGIYHLDWYGECEKATKAEELEPLKGFQIEKDYKFCDYCEEYQKEVESEGR